jgi:hypothetical protein
MKYKLFMLYEVPPLDDRLRNAVTAVNDDAFYNPWPTLQAIDDDGRRPSGHAWRTRAGRR